MPAVRTDPSERRHDRLPPDSAGRGTLQRAASPGPLNGAGHPHGRPSVSVGHVEDAERPWGFRAPVERTGRRTGNQIREAARHRPATREEPNGARGAITDNCGGWRPVPGCMFVFRRNCAWDDLEPGADIDPDDSTSQGRAGRRPVGHGTPHDDCPVHGASGHGASGHGSAHDDCDGQGFYAKRAAGHSSSGRGSADHDATAKPDHNDESGRRRRRNRVLAALIRPGSHRVSGCREVASRAGASCRQMRVRAMQDRALGRPGPVIPGREGRMCDLGSARCDPPVQVWWAVRDLNPRPLACHASALPTAPTAREGRRYHPAPIATARPRPRRPPAPTAQAHAIGAGQGVSRPAPARSPASSPRAPSNR